MSPELKLKKTTKKKIVAIPNENPVEIKRTADHEIVQIHGKNDRDHEITKKRRTKKRKTKRNTAQLLDPLPRNHPDPVRIPNPIRNPNRVIPVRIPMDPVNAKGINPENHQEKTKNLLLKKNRNLVKNLVKNPKNIDRTILVRIKNIENLHRNPVTKTKKKNDEKIAEKETKKTNRKILSECNIVDDRVAKLRVRVGYLTSSTGNPLLLNVGYRV